MREGVSFSQLSVESDSHTYVGGVKFLQFWERLSASHSCTEVPNLHIWEGCQIYSVPCPLSSCYTLTDVKLAQLCHNCSIFTPVWGQLFDKITGAKRPLTLPWYLVTGRWWHAHDNMAPHGVELASVCDQVDGKCNHIAGIPTTGLLNCNYFSVMSNTCTSTAMQQQVPNWHLCLDNCAICLVKPISTHALPQLLSNL
jgi:hypothetical protein